MKRMRIMPVTNWKTPICWLRVIAVVVEINFSKFNYVIHAHGVIMLHKQTKIVVYHETICKIIIIHYTNYEPVKDR